MCEGDSIPDIYIEETPSHKIKYTVREHSKRLFSSLLRLLLSSCIILWEGVSSVK